MAKQKAKTSVKPKEQTVTQTETPGFVSYAYVDVELLQAVKIGKFTYSAGRTIGLKKETADDLIKDNKAKQV